VWVSLHLSHDKLRKFITRPGGGAEQWLNRKGIAIESIAKELASVGYPNVQTGRYRAGFTFEITNDGTEMILHVGTNVEYAIHLEYGTRSFRVAPNGYRVLTRALEQGASA
jgi:hypothetical protein